MLAPATPGLSHGFGGDTVAMLSSVYCQVYTAISLHDLCASDQSIRRSGSRKFLYDQGEEAKSPPDLWGGGVYPLDSEMDNQQSTSLLDKEPMVYLVESVQQCSQDGF